MFSRIRMALRAVFDRRVVETEMEIEMRLHLEMETEANLRRGMSPVEARRAALVAFGGLEQAKEATRDERGTRWLETIAADIRFAFRGMGRQPGFAVTVIVLMALGTGANTAIFSVVDEMVLRPLPFADGDRMVELTATAGNGQFEIPPSRQLFDLWRARSTAVEEVVPFGYFIAPFGDTSRVPLQQVTGAEITAGMMTYTGLRPILGRDIQPSDTLPGAPRVAIIGHHIWSRQMAGSDSAVGATVLLAGIPHTVIGVAPREFFIPYTRLRDVFVALRADSRSARSVIAKLREGRTLAEANREVAALAKLTTSQSGIPEDPPRIKDVSSLSRSGPRRGLLVLFGAVGFVLLIACANVANLLLVRAGARQREFAVRGALGAGRGRLTGQLFTEAISLSVIGGLLGFVVALGLLKLVIAVQPESIGIQGRVDRVVLGWTLMLSVVTGVLFGIAPALMIGDGRVGELLKASARATTGSATSARFRSGLVVFEVAMSVVLLIGAGLMVRTLSAMQRADLGMDPRNLSSVEVRFARDADSLLRRDALITLQRRVAVTPGIDAATLTMTTPPDFAVGLAPIEIEGHPLTDTIGAIAYNYGQPDFFAVAGLRFVEGRAFQADGRFSDRVGAPEIVINERFARRYWPSGALGGRVKWHGVWATVVGVVRDIDIPGDKGLESGLQVYQPMSLAPSRAELMVKSRLPAVQVETLVRQAIRASGARVVVLGFSTTESQLARSRSMQRFSLALIGGFAILAVVLAAIGLHAVISYSVHQRLREIGIRIALGAQTSQVARLVFRHGVLLVIGGVVIGCATAVIATRAIRSQLYGVEPGDPLTTGLVAASLLVVAVVASASPARRATRVDPVEMIRAE